MKEFFYIANSAFERLPFMHGRVYSKAVSILISMSLSQSCVMMLDLELYDTIDHMFHLFLNGIRTEHPHEVFISMEKIMMTIIHNNVDNDKFSLVLVKILLNKLRRENQNVAPISFKLAENTLKNCSSDLKTYLPEAVRCLDVPIEDYAEAVVSLFQDVTQKHIMGSKDTVENVSRPGKSGLETEAHLCNLSEGIETQNSKNELYDENQGVASHCFDNPDEAGKAMHGQQEQKPEELHTGRKRIRRPSSLQKAEEGYDPFWMLIDWRSMKSVYKRNKNINFPAKTKTSKDLLTKPADKNISDSISPRPGKMKKASKRNEEASVNIALEPTSEEIIILSEDEDQPIGIFVKRRSGKGKGPVMKGSPVKKSRRKAVDAEDLNEDVMNHSEKGQGSFTKVSLVKKSRRKPVVPEDLEEDIVIVASKGRPVSSQDEARSVEVSKQNEKGSVPRPRKRPSKMKKESKRNTGVSANKALEPTNEEMVVVLEDEDQARDICVKGSSVEKSRKKAIVTEDLNVDIMNRSGSEKGQGSLTKVSPVKKSRRKTVASEDLKEDIMRCSEKRQGSLTKVSPVKKSRRKIACGHWLLSKMKPDVLKCLSKAKKEVCHVHGRDNNLPGSCGSAEDDCPMLCY